MRVDRGGSIVRTISLSVLFSVVDISRVATVHVGGTSGMVYIPVSMGSSYRYIGVRVSIVRRDIGWGIRTVSLSVLFSVVDISRVTTVHVGGTSGMVYISVSMGSSCRYIGVRVSIIRRDIGLGHKNCIPVCPVLRSGYQQGNDCTCRGYQWSE